MLSPRTSAYTFVTSGVLLDRLVVVLRQDHTINTAPQPTFSFSYTEVKVAHTRLPSVPELIPVLLAVSLQVM